MSFLSGKKVLLGISAGVAAYKAIFLLREIQKAGAEVKVIMTENATKLISPVLLRELSGNPVSVSMWQDISHWNVAHIALAAWANIVVVAPATANIIGKLANGIADDMLSTTVLASTSPIVVVPAMNTNMYNNPILQRNIESLRQHNYVIIDPTCGDLACGTTGVGRYPENREIIFAIEKQLTQNSLAGKKVLVTAGGTREPIDPVRYIGNRSSGKMGYAIARAAALQGAEVVLISATDTLEPPVGVQLIQVFSANDMKNAVDQHFDSTDIVIKAAAVADYRPTEQATQKIKKTEDSLRILLKKNPDILYELGQRKKHQILVGFAAETENLLEYAKIKMKKKNLDMLVANDVTQPGAGFNSDTNIVSLLYKNGTHETFAQMTKNEVATLIINKVVSLL